MMITHDQLVLAREALLERSYVTLDATEIDEAVVALSSVLAQQIVELHKKFDLQRPLTTDMLAADVVMKRQVA